MEKQGRFRKWLPDKDSNLNKQSQNLLCYHYTIGQWENRSGERLKLGGEASRFGIGGADAGIAATGAGDGIRTRNRLFTKQVLYR